MTFKKSCSVFLSLGLSLLLAACGGSSKPIAVTITASATTVDAGNSITLTVAVTNDAANSGVNWSVTGGGTLTNTTPTSATYNAPAPSATAVTATVTATSIKDSTKSTTITITVPAAPSISTGGLASATVGTAYSATLTATGGIPPYTWALTSGTLPTGMTMTAAGVISGTPSASAVGTSNLTFKVTDSGTPNPLTATVNLSITINAAPAITFPTTTLADATFNAAYSGAVAATGGAGTLTYSITAGALPTGLTMSSAGAITGTPTIVGTFPITVKAADAFGDSGTQAFTLLVKYPPLVVTAATLPTGYVGTAYASTTLAATGGSGTGFTWSLANSTTLPAGLTLSTAGVITGNPTTTGTTNFTVKVTDSASNTGTLAMAITVKPAVSITTSSPLPTGYVGSVYSQTLSATGGSGSGYTWAISGGTTAPAGLSLSSAGVLSGTPTTTGSPTFKVTVTDSASNTATATFAMTISPGVSITTASLPDGYQTGVYAPVTLAATGGSGSPYTWTWAAAGGSSIPAGMQLSTAGVLSGTPTVSGTFNVVITAKDGVNNTASVTFTFKIEAVLAITTSATLPSGTKNVAYSQTLQVSGGSGTGYTWSTTGANTLATVGLSFDTSTGKVTGTPTTTGTGSFTAIVTDSQSHTAQTTFTVTVYNALTITTVSLPATDAGVAYSQTLNAAGGTGSGYTWATTGANNLSTFGLTLSSGGVLSGTPSSVGTVNFTAQVTDSGSATATQALTLTVYNALVLPPPNPSSLPDTVTGANYSGTVQAVGGSGAYTWTVTGFPQNGLNYSTAGAVLTVAGKTTAPGPVTFSASVKDTTTGQSVGPFNYSIGVVNPAPLTLPTPNPSSLPSATVNQAYAGSISATGGVPPYTWTVNTVSVPTNGSSIALSDGLTVSNNGGTTLQVSGTPTGVSNVAISASVSDSASHTVGPTNYTVAVNSAGSQVTGHISLSLPCGGSAQLPTVTVSINTSPVQTVTTDSTGNYSFASIPNGTYTITPSITGPTSVFYPATHPNVTVNNAPVHNMDFIASLAYTVSGNVNYSGAATGRIYIFLTNNNCGGGNSTQGTSITGPGAFTIRGVQPGQYGLSAWLDPLGFGYANASDPSGFTSPVNVSSNVSGAAVTMSDHTAATPTSGPKVNNVAPVDQGIVVEFKPITTNVGGQTVEAATSYTVQWSTSSSFSSPASKTLPAGGANGTGVWFLNNDVTGLAGSFTNGTTYYIRVKASVGSSDSPWTVFGGGTPTGVVVGEPTAANTISGTVTFPGTATGPLIVGYFDQSNGNVYSTRITNPVSPQPYSVQVPNGSNYFNFAILDQNKDGAIDPGDVSNTHGGNDKIATVVSGNATSNITLGSAGSTGTVSTTHWNSIGSSGSSTGFNLNFEVRASNKLPVTATLMSGPFVLTPIDFGVCIDCGTQQFDQYMDIAGNTPTVGDSYSILVTYSDGTSETLTAQVTGVLNAFATNLAPTLNSSTSTTPTFTWTDPANASNYTYQFYLSGNSGTVWQIPGNNSNLNGFASTITSITWGTDPTGDSSNTPSVPSLTHGQQYNWQINVMDASGNQAQTRVQYNP